MLEYPLQELRHRIDLVVEMSVGELDYFIDKFGDPRCRLG
jgi:hypothetical protein